MGHKSCLNSLYSKFSDERADGLVTMTTIVRAHTRAVKGFQSAKVLG